MPVIDNSGWWKYIVHMKTTEKFMNVLVYMCDYTQALIEEEEKVLGFLYDCFWDFSWYLSEYYTIYKVCGSLV